MTPILELRGITKKFPKVIANDHISLDLQKGEILALLGENGAGKTTLMNIIYGLYSPDEGEILINGTKVDIKNPRDAIKHGIGMVHQHFMLVPVFTVAENVMLGTETTDFGTFLKRNEVKDEIIKISTKYGLVVDPDAHIEDLSVGVQQRVEIIKILYREAEILIFDEPTAVLTPQEVSEFFKVIRELIKQGKSIIFITHKLKEVMEIANRIAVVRNGKVVGFATPDSTTEADLANMMVGREVFLQANKQAMQAKDTVLDVKNISVIDDRGLLAVNNISFEVKSGEIFGLAGVQGNGQRELVEALYGLRKKENGTVLFQNQDISNETPRKIHDIGVGYIPEDRQQVGLILDLAVYDNLVLNTYYSPQFSKGIVLKNDAIKEYAEIGVKNFDVRPKNIFLKTSSLSGGNQQKVIVAREFSREIKMLIASQPTRGLDVGSIEYIHSEILKKRGQGCAILLISTELDEILSLSDRIGVIYRGQLLDIIKSDDASREQIGLLMAGINQKAKK